MHANVKTGKVLKEEVLAFGVGTKPFEKMPCMSDLDLLSILSTCLFPIRRKKLFSSQSILKNLQKKLFNRIYCIPKKNQFYKQKCILLRILN